MEPVAPDPEQPPRGARDRVRADDHRGGVAQQPAAEPLAEPRGRAPLVRAGQLPRGEIEERDDERQPGRERDRAAGRVVDGTRPRRPARPATPPRGSPRTAGTDRPSARPERRSRVGGSNRRPTTSRPVNRSVGSSTSDASRSANDSPSSGVGVEGAEQGVEILRGQRRPIGFLERPGIEDDADACRLDRPVRCRGAEPAECRGRGRGHPPSPAETSSGSRGFVRGVMSASALSAGRRVRRASRTSPSSTSPGPASVAVPPDGGRREAAIAELVGSQLDDDDERLDDDPAAHLRLADAPVAERDRHLADAGASRATPGTSSRSGRRSRRRGRRRTGSPRASPPARP